MPCVVLTSHASDYGNRVHVNAHVAVELTVGDLYAHLLLILHDFVIEAWRHDSKLEESCLPAALGGSFGISILSEF